MTKVKATVETTDRPPCYVSFEHVTLNYGDGKVLNDSKMWLYQSTKRIKRYALLGESGAGKSSVANLIMGGVVPQEGKVFFGGKALCYEEEFLRKHRASIGYVTQGLNGAVSFLSVLENVKRPAMLKGRSNGEAKELAQAALFNVGLDEQLWKKTPDQLSGGELQRALIAKTIVHAPSFMICDEPTSALDRPNARRVVKAIIKANIPTLIVTHDPALIAPYVDGLLIIYKGKITDITCLKNHQILGSFKSSEELLNLRRHIQPPEIRKYSKTNAVADDQQEQCSFLADLPLYDDVETTDQAG